MFAVNKILKRLTLTISSVMLVGMTTWLATPALSAQASPLADLGNMQIVAVAPKGTIQPKTDEVGFDELESGKEAAKIIPKDLGNSNKDIKGRIERAASELGDDQYQRVFGGITGDTKLSEAERKVEQNANR